MWQISFSRAVLIFLISSIRNFLFFEFLRDERFIQLSVNIFTLRVVLKHSFILSCVLCFEDCCIFSLIFWTLYWSLCLICCQVILCVYGDSRVNNSFLLHSVYIGVVQSFDSLCSQILNETAGCVQSSYSASWSNSCFSLSLVILYMSADSSTFISIGTFPVRIQSASLDVVRHDFDILMFKSRMYVWVSMYVCIYVCM